MPNPYSPQEFLEMFNRDEMLCLKTCQKPQPKWKKSPGEFYAAGFICETSQLIRRALFV